LNGRGSYIAETDISFTSLPCGEGGENGWKVCCF